MNNRRDFIPNMRKIPAKEGIRLVRTNLNAEDALRINGVHLTEEDIKWLNEPNCKYVVTNAPRLGTICALKTRLK